MEIEEMKSASMYHKFIALDTESTGFQPNNTYSKLIEIGAVKIEKGIVIDTFDELINPGIKIPKNIEELTGITNEMVEDKDNYNEVLKRFRDWCDGDYVLIMHNAIHDLKFLNYFGNKIGINFDEPYIDTQIIGKNVLTPSIWKRIDSHTKPNFKLSSLASLYRIPDLNHHRANNDAELTWQVFNHLKQTMLRKEPELIQRQPYLFPKKKESYLNINSVGKVRIEYSSPWEKGNKKRLYVHLINSVNENKSYGDIYYDFVYHTWNIKECFFPILTFKDIENKILKEYSSNEMKWDNFKTKKSLNISVEV